MAWSTPRTWTSGEVVTAANLNTYVSDNLTALSTPPFCDVYATTPGNTSGTSFTFTAVPFDSEIADSTGSMHSTATQTSRITVPIDGVYHVQGGFNTLSQSTQQNIMRCDIRLNGSSPTGTYTSTYVPSGSFGNYSAITQRYVRATAGQYFELFVASYLTTIAISTSSTIRPYLQVRWVGP